MGYSVKLGKGGHGLEVYDSEGKYAEEFSFKMDNGQEIKGYDSFRAFYFDSLAANSAGAYDAQMLENIYQQNPGWKEQVDTQLYDEYNRMLTEAINNINAKQVWDTPEDAAKNLHELFVPNLVQNLLDNKILESNRSSVAKKYAVSTLAACFQMSRYEKNRANVIDYATYNDRLASEKADGYCFGNTSVGQMNDYIQNAIAGEKSIPILRNISGIDYNDRQNVINSFYDENSPRNSCLAHADAVNCSYLGSVIYFSTGDYSYSSGNVSINGLVKMNSKLRLLECPLAWGRAGEYSCNRAIPEINRFRYAINQDADFDNKIKQQLMANENIGEGEAKVILSRLHNEINNDPGFCAILMGYDAIYGISYHFDVLNLGICDIVKQ